jgi:hypothetical protein
MNDFDIPSQRADYQGSNSNYAPASHPQSLADLDALGICLAPKAAALLAFWLSPPR